MCLGTFAFDSHVSAGKLTSHLNARAESRVSLQAPKPRLYPEGGLMLSENVCGSPTEARLPGRLAVLAQRGERTPVIPAPMKFLPRMHRSFRQQSQ
jgi:hypothetical protein